MCSGTQYQHIASPGVVSIGMASHFIYAAFMVLIKSFKAKNCHFFATFDHLTALATH